MFVGLLIVCWFDYITFQNKSITCYNITEKKLCVTATQKGRGCHLVLLLLFPKDLLGLFFELFPRIKPFANIIRYYIYQNSRKNVPKEVMHQQHLPSSRELFKERCILYLSSLFIPISFWQWASCPLTTPQCRSWAFQPLDLRHLSVLRDFLIVKSFLGIKSYFFSKYVIYSLISLLIHFNHSMINNIAIGSKPLKSNFKGVICNSKLL